MLEKDDVLKQSYDKLIDGRKEFFKSFENSEALVNGFEKYLFNDGQYTSSSLTDSVIFFSRNEDVKYYEWRNLNNYNNDVSKQLYKTMINCYVDPGEVSSNIQQKISKLQQLLIFDEVDLKQVEKAQAELLHYAIENDKDFALEYNCLLREQKNVLLEHCFDVAQYEKEYMQEFAKRFFEPGTFGFQKLHYLIERFSQNSDSYKFNERIKQCDTYKKLNKELFKSLNHVYGYEMLEPIKVDYFKEIQNKLESLHSTIKNIETQKVLDKENKEKNSSNDVLKQTKMTEEFKVRYSDLDKQAKQQIKEIIVSVMDNNPEIKELYNQLRAEYNQVVNLKSYYGEDNICTIMDDFDKRFFSPDVYDIKSSQNIIFKYAENVQRNKIVSQHYANGKIIRLQHKEQFQARKIKAKQQQVLQFAVKSMLYGLCQVFSESATDNDMYSQQGKRNIALQSLDGRFSKKRPNHKQQNISNLIQF